MRGIQTLGGIVTAGKSERACVRAAGLLLDYGWGRVPRAPAAEGGKGRVVVRHVVEPRGGGK